MSTTKIFGPPGTGKTTYLLDVVEDAINAGVAPERIAYVAFTKKAAEEAAARAMQRFNLSREQLPYFRTLHSIAFRSIGARRDDIMHESQYKELGYELGFKFTSVDDTSFVASGTSLGDKVARIESLSRLRSVSLDQQWIDCNYQDVDLSAARQWLAGLLRFKASKGLLDYTDLLEQFKSSLDVDLFILDEAQDLSPLQWSVVHCAAQSAKHTYMAGDDDQCIYDWAGADPEIFIKHPGDAKILPRSFRIPESIQALAEICVLEIRKRQPKIWRPKEAPGRVEYLRYEEGLDLARGTWLLLSRNHHSLLRFEQVAQRQGYAYIKDGRTSIDPATAKAILSWEHWRKGRPIKASEVKNLSKFIAALYGWVPKTDTTIDNAPLPLELRERDWMSVIDIPPRRREYFRSCLANGESLFSTPRITISTIHRAKGGEAENVVLIPDVTQNPWAQMDTDSEKRVLYVALTRAKESLTIISPQSNKFYRI
jgi:DNA helicase-2/ATP-dependent DNA helicase PcrA